MAALNTGFLNIYLFLSGELMNLKFDFAFSCFLFFRANGKINGTEAKISKEKVN
ncbi:Uncharacterised protein [Candidatus Bilamarchaeum dharawalense]|uniref:Uncharacterized protein n=1 Tax=Candidatus Bilamarchaeum dharawalense TaxID=2885759 RepID=A0A5E4LV93_9ARCH|nr:Uncharacterised protein [Candidatus Bilamarchaeum dharawalense]